MKTVVYLLIGAIAGAFASGAETTVTSVAFSDPSKPGVVQIWVSQGQVMVHGDAYYSHKTLQFIPTLPQKTRLIDAQTDYAS